MAGITAKLSVKNSMNASVNRGGGGYSPSASVTKVGDTATITITDKTGTTTAQVSDGQDGYSPTASVSQSGAVTTITITDKNGTTTAQINDSTDELSNDLTAIQATETASGSVVHLLDGSDALPVKSLKVNIVATQAGSGDPSPDNVRPISGWDAVTVTRAGENLLRNATIVQGTFDINTGGSAISAKRIRVDDYIPITPGEYRVGSAENYQYVIYAYDSSKVMIEAETVKSWKGADVPFTITNAAFIRLGFRKIGDSIITPDEIHNYYCTDGSTIATYPVPLGRTVYGGTLDVTTGELVVDTACIPLPSIAGTALSGTVRRFYTGIVQAALGYTAVVACDSLKASDTYVYTQLDYVSFSTDGRIVVTPTWGQELTTVEAFNAELTNHPINVVVKLATHQTYTLTPQEVELLLGENTIYADAGDIEISYVVGVEEYIVKNILPTNTSDGYISDGYPGNVKELKVEMTPVQDLHGYSNPWPAGGGKNLIDPSTLTVNTSYGITRTNNNDGSMSISGTSTSDSAVGVNLHLSDKYVVLKAGHTYRLNGNWENLTIGTNSMRVDMRKKEDTSVIIFHEQTASYTPTEDINARLFLRVAANYTVPDNVKCWPCLTVDNADTVYEPYSNVCPISGWDSLTVTRTGKNILEFPYDKYKPGNYTVNGVTFTISNDGTIATSGTAGTAGNYSAQVFIGRYNGKDIAGKIITGCPSGGSNTKYRISVQHYGSPWNLYISDYGTGAVIPDTVKDDDNVSVVVQIYKGINADGLIFKPMLRNAADADATFEPYQSESYHIPLGRTVYGGMLDVTTGELVVDKAIVDLGTLNWTKQNTSSGHYRFAAEADVYKTTSTSAVPDVICSAYPTITPDQSWRGVTGASCNSNIYVSYIFITDDSYSDAETFKTAMSGVMYCYRLATPQTYALTPQQVTLLKGINNIFADAGTVEVKYGADIHEYINNIKDGIVQDVLDALDYAEGVSY